MTRISNAARPISLQVHADKSAITLLSDNGDTIDWRPKQWGASNAQAYEARPIELQKGDQIQLTRNDHSLARINGQRGQIETIDPETRIAAIKFDNGKTQKLDLDRPQDQHIRHGYVETAFAAQGRTAQQVMIHADSAAANLVDQKSFYVALSRAKEKATIYTNDKQKLISAIQERTGERQVSLEGQTTHAIKLHNEFFEI